MALVRELKGKKPQFGENCFLAETAVVIGDVVMGDDCSIWYNAVLRGDVHYIKMGNKVNVQDNAMIHCTYQKSPTTIGNNVSIGHNAVVHGCTIHDNVLIGMGAIVMDDAVIHEGSVIAAGAVVLARTVVEPNSIYAGMPARKVKDIGEEMKGVIKRTADNYPFYATWFGRE